MIDKPHPEILALVAEVRARCEEATPGPWTLALLSPAGGMHCAMVRTPWNLPVASWSPEKVANRPDTLGRWETANYYFHAHGDGVDPDPEHEEPCCDCGPYAEAYRREEADLRFIAHARTDLPALCAAVEQLMAEVEARDERIRVLSEGIRAYRCVWPETKLTLECDRWAVREWERKHGEEVRTDG